MQEMIAKAGFMLASAALVAASPGVLKAASDGKAMADGAIGSGSNSAPSALASTPSSRSPSQQAVDSDERAVRKNRQLPIEQQIGSGGRPVGARWSRSPVLASGAMAATAHPLATQIALDILKQGGTAVDAAIAANAALGLMEPTGNGIGGDLFAIVLDPASGKLRGLNASGRTPRSQSLEQLRARLKGADSIPPLGPLPVTVPGAVDGWFALHEAFGRLPMEQILAPAIRYARQGHPVAPVIAHYFERNFAAFEERAEMFDFSNARATWFASGRPPQAGEILRNEDLARTLETIARGGRDAFYRGELTRIMVDYLQRQGSALDEEDFAHHTSEWVEPVCLEYRRGYGLCEMPPNSQGFAALQMVNILKNVDLSKWERGSPEVIHYLTEAKRLAFADLARFYADPDFSKLPQALLSEEYGKQRYALIDPARARRDIEPGAPELEKAGDTTYLTVADGGGMMVSLIQSNYRGMGSGLVPDGLGFMFQDRGELFSLDPLHPNAYGPGKRPFHTIIPAFMTRNRKPWMSFGVMGGAMQPQGHVQILVNIADYAMNLQEAGDAARINHDGGRQPTEPLAGPARDALGTLHVEPGIPPATIDRLRAMGHRVEVVSDGIMFGGYQAIARDDESGVLTGATEMRKDGQAQGF